jgi:hypothetical protein
MVEKGNAELYELGVQPAYLLQTIHPYQDGDDILKFFVTLKDLFHALCTL